jgi:hypothetical protein
METTQIESQKRGQLTDRIKQRSAELFGYEISQKELRLMPYLQYQLVNEQRLKPEHLNEDDREILAKWVSKGYILDGVSECKGRPMMSEGVKLKITKEFWDSILEILWLGYVDLH